MPVAKNAPSPAPAFKIAEQVHVPGAKGLTINDSIAAQSSKFYRVMLLQGFAWRVDLSAEAPLHPTLSLLVEDALGRKVASADNRLRRPDVSLLFTAPATGEYKVVVASLAESTGNITLTIQPPNVVQQPKAAPRPGPTKSLERPAKTYDVPDEGLTVRDHITTNSDLSLDSLPQDLTRQVLRGGPLSTNRLLGKVFAVNLRKGQAYRFELAINPDFDASLAILDAKPGHALLGYGPIRGEQVYFRAPDDDVYFVVVATKWDHPGPILVRTWIDGTTHPDFLPRKQPTKIHTVPANKSLVFNDAFTDSDPRDKVFRASPSKTYALRMSQGRFYSIDVTATEVLGHRLYLRLERPDGKVTGGLAPVTTLQTWPPSTGVYRLVVIGESNGKFQLRVK
jgi:hypothetical protein